jgi:hypothetical protein
VVQERLEMEQQELEERVYNELRGLYEVEENNSDIEGVSGGENGSGGGSGSGDEDDDNDDDDNEDVDDLVTRILGLMRRPLNQDLNGMRQIEEELIWLQEVPEKHREELKRMNGITWYKVSIPCLIFF